MVYLANKLQTVDRRNAQLFILTHLLILLATKFDFTYKFIKFIL